MKAWHDNSERTYDGLKKKREVFMSFMDFGVYTNETTQEEDYSWFNLPWMMGGYSTKMQKYMGEIVKDCLLVEISNDRILKWLKCNPFTM